MTRWPAIHDKCGGVAFYLLKEPLWGDVIEARHAILPNGDRPKDGKPIICGSCGKLIDPSLVFHPKVFFPGPVEEDALDIA
jgi:hypothetical protein